MNTKYIARLTKHVILQTFVYHVIHYYRLMIWAGQHGLASTMYFYASETWYLLSLLGVPVCLLTLKEKDFDSWNLIAMIIVVIASLYVEFVIRWT